MRTNIHQNTVSDPKHENLLLFLVGLAFWRSATENTVETLELKCNNFCTIKVFFSGNLYNMA